ncbi:MAG: hypothetical protein SP1CHLAM54_13980 [Chlamydiia bacterium]|nr:hypothetical protein [Chlamydiia bacterium]MCH9616290.1 hypothetical protein [Chlamydiia bacterium]MCH9629724.1 hypothetical protein [Chlamydiia bacterium]
MKLIHLKNTPILEQLKLEEGLLRTKEEDYCLINEGSPRAIIMGISGKHEELVHPSAFEANIPVIKRYSGGGTVIVDENTVFVSFICNKASHDFPAYPEPIMRWSEGIYKKVFNLDDFGIQGNDYAIGNLKCGGNAQYIRKDRFVHHTTFLWDYSPENMEYLLMPKSQPKYRENRTHDEFLTRLKNHLPSKEEFIARLKKQFNTSDSDIPILEENYRQSTIQINK